MKSSVFEWFGRSKMDLQNVRFSNGFGIQMFDIRALTVLATSMYFSPFGPFKYNEAVE